MNKYRFSLIALTLLFIGCGGDNIESNPSESNPSQSNPKTIKEATKNLNAFNSFKSIKFPSADASKNRNKLLTSKGLYDFQNIQTSTPCAGGGTISVEISEDAKTTTNSFNQCQNGTTFMNGKIITNQDDNNNYSVKYDKLTFKADDVTQYMNMNMGIKENGPVTTLTMNGIIRQTFASDEINEISMKNLISEDYETESESWSKINGEMAFKGKCFSGSYQFNTIKELVDAKDGSENIESGVLELNGATYTFKNPDVTIKVGNESKTMLQSKLEEEMEAEIESGCNI